MVDRDNLYVDEDGTEYVETRTPGVPDKRVYTDDQGHRYIERGVAARTVAVGLGAVALALGLTTMPFGDVVPEYGRIAAAIAPITSLPFGNFLFGTVTIVIGVLLLRFAIRGREWIDVD